MLPTTPTKKKPAIFTSLFSNGQRDEPVAAGEPAPVKGRVHLIREVFIRVVSLVLAVAFIVWGPAGNFIAGRAFTITTTNEVTYVFYNWTVTLPISTQSLSMQAWNNRLLGDIRFAAAPSTDTHYTINIETTAPSNMFKLTPWSMDETAQSGFDVEVNDLLPNTYGIDYANIVVYIPADAHYSDIIWNTFPLTTSSVSLSGHKWNVNFDNLTNAGIYFDQVRIVTDSGAIASTGIRASEGYFQTNGGLITGEYTIPTDQLVFNETGVGS